MPAIQSTQTPSTIRPQDLVMQFLAEQTQLAVRLSQNLQEISRSLLERVRQTAANRIPLERSLSNTTKQTIFQIAGAVGSTVLKMAATQAGFKAGIEINPLHKANFTKEAESMNVIAALAEKAAGGSITYLQGTGNAEEFRQQELQHFQQGNAACQKAVQDTQDTIVSMAKQMISH